MVKLLSECHWFEPGPGDSFCFPDVAHDGMCIFGTFGQGFSETSPEGQIEISKFGLDFFTSLKIRYDYGLQVCKTPNSKMKEKWHNLCGKQGGNLVSIGLQYLGGSISQ